MATETTEDQDGNTENATETQTVDSNDKGDDGGDGGGAATSDENSEYHGKAFSFQHLVFVGLFLLSFYNYGTDIAVCIDWISYSAKDACSNFQDYNGCLQNAIDNIHNAGAAVLILTTIGFIFGLILKVYQMKILIKIYKHAKTKMDVETIQLEALTVDLYLSSFPLFFEDIVGGLIVITSNISSIGDELYGIDYDLVKQSVAVTCVDLIGNFIYFMYIFITHRKKLSNENNNNNNDNNNNNENEKKCNLRKIGPKMVNFCLVYYIIVGIGLLIAVIYCLATVSEFEVSERSDGVKTSAYVEYMPNYECTNIEAYGSYGDEYSEAGNGQSLYYPKQLIDPKYGCDISEYELWIAFFGDYDSDTDEWLSLNGTLKYRYLDTQAFSNPNCTVVWSGYPNQNESLYHISADTYCFFTVDFEYCGNFTIPCQFYEGEAVWDICFDYCQFNL